MYFELKNNVLYCIVFQRGAAFAPNELMNQETLHAFWRGVSTFAILRI